MGLVLVLSLLLGMRHATDPDHVVAVTTIVTRNRSLAGAVAVGGAWGVGHTLTILLVGGGIVLLGWVVPERLELAMEFAVGIMLIGLGLASFRPAASDEEGHDRVAARVDEALGGSVAYGLVRPLLVGVVHGLAGSAAVALVVLATIPGPGWSVAYLLVFGVGTVLGMMLVTASIALPLLHPRLDSPRHLARIRAAAGACSVGFGLFLVYHVGLVEGLLLAG